MNYRIALFAVVLAMAATFITAAPGSLEDHWVSLPHDRCENDHSSNIEALEVKNYPLYTNAKQVSIRARGSFPTSLKSGAKLIVTAKIGFITLIEKTLDACSELNRADPNQRCPILANVLTELTSTNDIPDGVSIPAEVNITVIAKVVNTDGTLVFCVQTKVKFNKPKSLNY